MNFLELVNNRYSVRSYEERQIENYYCPLKVHTSL